MAFPTLSRRHAATPSPPASSPRKCIRSESLRSTWMTSGSDSVDDQDLEQNTDELQMFVQLQRPLSDWVYWQRDVVLLPHCWTRVFAVFSGNLLWLYRYEDASARSLLLRMRVTALDAGADMRQLQFRDAATAANVQLCMPDTPAFYRWHSHVSTAVAKFPPVEEEQELVPAVAHAMKKKTFWKALATAVKASSYCQVAGHEDNALVVFDPVQRRGRSLGERWKSVTTTLRRKLSKRQPQLQL
uniref:PH domain-containing protein n=1 Tax=Phytophthora ramorum TaxID=164328 RepID=H3H0J5_PHYRM